MSILNDLARDVASLLFPSRCAVCGESLARGERTVCTLCRATAPLTGYWREADNPVVRRCWGMVPVCQASGFLFFVRERLAAAAPRLQVPRGVAHGPGDGRVVRAVSA